MPEPDPIKGGFYRIESPGEVDVTDDSPEMLRRFADEAGVDIELHSDGGSRTKARIVATVVVPGEKPKKVKP